MMMTIAKTSLRPVRDRLQTAQLFQWLENALEDPRADTREFFARIESLAGVLQQAPPSLQQDTQQRHTDY